jgi:hypothetical protein
LFYLHTQLVILKGEIMNYDIKIRGDESDNGLLEFDRLSKITQTTKEIATKALMLKLRGFSDITPDSNLKKALEIRMQSLRGSKLEGTDMLLDCDEYEKTLKNFQNDLFNSTENILQLTPMALVINTFRSALLDGEDKNDLDKPLIKSLLKFKKNFVSDKEVFCFSNRQSIPEIEVRLEDFKKIEVLEDSIPEPKKIIINGQLDEVKISKSKLGLITEDGIVNVFANDTAIIEGILKFIGKEVTISGMANFKPSGQLSYVEIEQYSEPGMNDNFFSKKPNAMNAEQQILFQLKSGKKANPLSDIIGKWPGDETDEEFEKMLKELD